MSPVVEDVVITRPSGSPLWRTVLVGGFMGGERGIFALDVTNPSLFLTENATNAAQIGLWEFNSDDDADMGYSFSIPSIGMMPNGKWAAIFGNGYNSTNGTGNLGSTGKEKDVQGNYSAGRASLFIVFLDGGLDGTWTYGTDYIKITAPDSTDPTVTAAISTSIDCSSASCNGLSSPQVVDTNLDRKIDRVYAGDLKGNMWVFNLSSTNPSNWKVAYGTTSSPTPLFTSTYHKSANVLTPLNNAGKSPVQQNTTRQPITSRPVLLRNLKAHGYPNLLVLFGTGQYVTLADTSSTTMQGFYGVWDHGTGGLTPANLIQQGYLDSTFTVGTTTTTVAANSIRVLTKNAIVYDSSNTTTNQGWFINFGQ
jgi:type IV pilus assembly protein PilY1